MYQRQQQTTLNKLSRQVNPEVAMNPNSEITPEDLFKSYPWTATKRALWDTLVTFGQYCSMLIGLYSIYAIEKDVCAI